MKISDLSTVNAFLNSLSFIFLILGFRQIRAQNRQKHKRWMLTALFTSLQFLISYSIYHYYVGSVPYPYHDWTRPVYFALLIPHVILAALMAPFIIYMVTMALKGNFKIHKRIARIVLPVWLFVSFSGVMVYLLLYGPR